METEEKQFIESLTQVQELVHECARFKGFWDEATTDEAKILLMHTELSEAAEALREDNPPYDVHQHKGVDFDEEKWGKFSQVEMELADAIIRILDYAGRKKYRMAEAILAKHSINRQRPPKHGKKF